jgi:hypothetical protein
MRAFISEIASCDGAPDVNGNRLNADGSRMTFVSQMACAGPLRESMDIPSLYKAVGGS